MKIIARINNGYKTIGYVVQHESKGTVKLKREEVIKLASQKQIENARVQNYTPKNTGIQTTILRGIGIDLKTLPVYNANKLMQQQQKVNNTKKVVSSSTGNIEPNIKPNNPEEIIKNYNNKMKMLNKYPVFDFEVQEGNIYIKKYHDKEDRKEVKIPEFVYGF